MNRQTRSSGCRPCLVAVFALFLLDGGARAEKLLFQNDTSIPVVLQSACVDLGGKLRRDRPYMLGPNDRSPAVVLPGDKIITLYDAKVPSRVLYQGVIPGGTEDQVFSIQINASRTGLKLEKQRSKRPQRP